MYYNNYIKKGENKVKKFRLLLLCLVVLLASSLSGCSLLNKGLVKLNLKNDNFNYIQENKVEKIIIQSTRDSGFRFIMNDNNAIEDVYRILSKGKIKDKKTSLDPDYLVEVYVGDEVKSYNYVVSVDERGVGNFYDEDNVYLISQKLDDTILSNLSTIRKPKNFEDIYYNSILEVLKVKKDVLNSGDNKVGININGDVDCLKYMFSVDIKTFEKNMNKLIPGATITQSDTSDYDTVVTVKNRGYSTKVFKTTIIVDDKVNKSYETYYVQGNYQNKGWNITVSEPNVKPENW